MSRLAPLLIACATTAAAAADRTAPTSARAFLDANCGDCHAGGAAEGGFALDSLPDEPTLEDAGRWDRVHDRLRDGEMPPPDDGYDRPADADRFLADVAGWLAGRQRAEADAAGRSPGRRLTSLQLERTLQAVLGVDVPMTHLLPPDPRRHGFTTVSAGRVLSQHDLADHLEVVDFALDEAFRRAGEPDDREFERFTAEGLSRKDRGKRSRDPMFEGGAAMVWQAKLPYVGRLPVTESEGRGRRRRLTFTASAVNAPPDGLWCTVRVGACTSAEPAMADVAVFLATPERRDHTFEAWVPVGHMFEVRPADSRLKQGKTPGGQVGYGEMPPQHVAGLALHGATLETVHAGPDGDGVRALLFGDVPTTSRTGGRGKNRRTMFEPDPGDPAAALGRLMRDFADRAFRRPAPAGSVAIYVEAAEADLAAGAPFAEALRGGYRALLCGPRFLYHTEEPGELDGPALAARLSYFLTAGPPDADLAAAGADGRILDDAELRRQVDRLLSGDGLVRFVRDYARQWLDLSEMSATDVIQLYPGFDDVVRISMGEQTRGLLTKMLAENLSVTHVVDADFALVNARLAEHYDLPEARGRFAPADGANFKPVPIGPESPRGGLLTQGAVLKVTADGATTSPVLRGVWASERLLGISVPPPPENVPAVEPDTRGAVTIREQLAKHRADPSCASCHDKVDPVGFALEQFDPGGAFRLDYVRWKDREIVPRAPVDAGHALPTGEAFADAAGFQRLVAARPEPLAENFAAHLLTYGTGAPPSFADREALRATVARSAGAGYGARTLLTEAVLSDLFRRK